MLGIKEEFEESKNLIAKRTIKIITGKAVS